MSADTYPVLYSFRRCPYAIRARMAIASADIRCELREVKLSDKPGEMLRLSPKGTVPVLQLPDGKVIDESLEVMYWALQQNDPGSWLRLDPDSANTLIQKNDGEFKLNLDRYKYHVRYPENSQLFYRQAAEEFLQLIEEALVSHNSKGLLQDKITLADIAIFPFIRQFSRVDYDWFRSSDYHLTLAWLDKIEGSTLFKKVMFKYEPWQAGRGNSYTFPE